MRPFPSVSIAWNARYAAHSPRETRPSPSASIAWNSATRRCRSASLRRGAPAPPLAAAATAATGPASAPSGTPSGAPSAAVGGAPVPRFGGDPRADGGEVPADSNDGDEPAPSVGGRRASAAGGSAKPMRASSVCISSGCCSGPSHSSPRSVWTERARGLAGRGGGGLGPRGVPKTIPPRTRSHGLCAAAGSDLEPQE